MDDLQRLIIERACEALVIDYALHLDHKRADAFASLFTDDAHFKHPRLAEAMTGSAKIRQWINAYAPDILIRHVTANIRVHIVDADHATGVSYTTAYRIAGHDGKLPAPLPGPYCVVEYEDRYRRTRAGWKIAHRSSQYIFRADGSVADHFPALPSLTDAGERCDPSDASPNVVPAERAGGSGETGLYHYVVALKLSPWEGTLSEVVIGTIPFHLIMFLLLVLLMLWPDLALWLPRNM